MQAVRSKPLKAFFECRNGISSANTCSAVEVGMIVLQNPFQLKWLSPGVFVAFHNEYLLHSATILFYSDLAAAM
jgi:hypothetical protein